MQLGVFRDFIRFTFGQPKPALDKSRQVLDLNVYLNRFPLLYTSPPCSEAERTRRLAIQNDLHFVRQVAIASDTTTRRDHKTSLFSLSFESVGVVSDLCGQSDSSSLGRHELDTYVPVGIESRPIGIQPTNLYIILLFVLTESIDRCVHLKLHVQ